MTGPEPEVQVFSPKMRAVGKLLVRLAVSLGGGWAFFKLLPGLVTPGPVEHSTAHYIVVGTLALVAACVAGGKHTLDAIDHLTGGAVTALKAWMHRNDPPPPTPPAP